MRILLLTHYFAPESGAPQRRWEALIREFTAAGHEVAVFCPPPHHPNGTVPTEYRRYYRAGASERLDDGTLVFRVGYLPHRGDMVTRTADHLVSSLSSIGRATRVIRSGKFTPDVVIATAPAIPTLIAGQQLARRLDVPFIAEMRDAWPDLVTHIGGAGGGVKSLVKQAIHAWVTGLQRSASTVVTTTERFADVLRERGMRDVVVIRNGTRVSNFMNVPTVSDDHDELRVLYMGTMGRSQGLDLLIDAAAQLRDEGVQIVVRIIGQGHDAPRLRELNRELGNPVEIRDQVPAAEVAQHYAWADTTVASLRAWDPFEWTVPSKLYELLATGRHVTGVLAGEGADILAEAEAGDIVAPGDQDALVTLWRELASDRARLRVSDAGREWVRKNASFRGLAPKYLDVLESNIA